MFQYKLHELLKSNIFERKMRRIGQILLRLLHTTHTKSRRELSVDLPGIQQGDWFRGTRMFII